MKKPVFGLKSRDIINLEIKYALEFNESSSIIQVTYVDHLGNLYKSVEAIASGLEHINLAWATLGWFMRFPIVLPFLQMVVDTMNFDSAEKECNI